MVDVEVHKKILADVEEFKNQLCDKYKIDLQVGVDIRAKLDHKSIIKKAAEYFDLTYTEVVSISQKGDFAKARRYLVYYLQTEYNLGPSYIGKLLNKDHSSAIYHFDKMSNELSIYGKVADEYNNFKTFLNQF